MSQAHATSKRRLGGGLGFAISGLVGLVVLAVIDSALLPLLGAGSLHGDLSSVLAMAVVGALGHRPAV